MNGTSSNADRVQQLLAGLRAAFVAELPERLNVIEGQVLACQHTASRTEAFDELFRAVHSLKGSGGTHGLAIITTVCHQFEDSLKKYQPDLERLAASEIDLWLRYVDLLRRVGELAAGGIADFSTIDAGLAALTSKGAATKRGLLVMASPTQVALCEGALEGLPVALVVEQDGMNALHRLLHERFEFLVTGNSLPGLNGVALLAALRCSDVPSRHLPAVLVTNSASLAVPAGIAINKVIVRDAGFVEALRQAVMSFSRA